MSYDEFYPETLHKIRKISPKSVTMHFFADDEWRYDDWSRHYALFLDYILVAEEKLEGYKKDGIGNVIFLHGSSTKIFKQMDVEKKYDVTFIGMPISDRYDYVKFLHKKGIKIRVFGKGWDKHPDIKEICGGYLDNDDYVKMLNESKINLSFSKGILPGSSGGQLKGRVLECGLCKAFALIEYTDRNVAPFNEKKINFKTKKELLDKVKYFLKNEKERERLAEKVYNGSIKKFTWEAQFEKFFKRISKKKINEIRRKIPKMNEKVVGLTRRDLLLGKEHI